jgi:DNA helicase-2/ATP-dependent DNA helicase PcrA
VEAVDTPERSLFAGRTSSRWGAGRAFTDEYAQPAPPDHETYSQEHETAAYAVGMRVQHDRFGKGIVRKVEGHGEQVRVTVIFDAGGERKFLAHYAPMRPL